MLDFDLTSFALGFIAALALLIVLYPRIIGIGPEWNFDEDVPDQVSDADPRLADVLNGRDPSGQALVSDHTAYGVDGSSGFDPSRKWPFDKASGRIPATDERT